MTRRIPFPVGNFSEIYDLMYTYDEHSGAGNTGWPQLNSSQPLEQQNREYVQFTSDAKTKTHRMIDSGLSIVAQPSKYDTLSSTSNTAIFPLVVYNGNSWKRTDVVRIDAPAQGQKIIAVRDVTSNSNIPFDIDTDGKAVFVVRDVPAIGYRTLEVTTSQGAQTSTLKVAAGRSASNAKFSVDLEPDGTVRSIRDLAQQKELVNNKGQLPFNDLLRVEGADASKVSYPVEPTISVHRGTVMTELTVSRDRSLFPVTKITLYNDIDRVELRNELDPGKFPFPGGNKNWNDSYYFAFPFNISKDFKIMRGEQKWFEKLPDDYLPGARKDSVTTQHLIGFTDGQSTALLAHRQAFHWVYAGYVATKVRPKNAPAEFPAVFTGKFPLPEATIYSRAVRFGQQADTHDLGMLNIWTTEPGMSGNMVFEYAIAGEKSFDAVGAWRLGSDFDLPLIPEYTSVKPVEPTHSFFTIDQPNVDIVDVKPLAENVIHGEVSSAPLDPPVNRSFVIRLQEFAGRPATAVVSLPGSVKSASLLNLTEDKTVGAVDSLSPLRVKIGPYQTVTIKVEIE